MEIYWITRLGDIKNGLEVTFVISTVTAVFALVGALIACDTPTVLAPLRRLLIASTVVAGITGICYMLTPTTREALLIYGYDKAIDYYQSNDKLKQLPDKFILYLDSVLTTTKTKEEGK